MPFDILHPASPVVLESASVNRSATTIGGLEFRLRNRASVPLVAFTLKLSVTATTGETTDTFFTDDYFLGRSWIAPGTTLDRMKAFTITMKAPIARAELSLSFAQMANGDAFGPAATVASADLLSRYKQEISVFSQAGAVIAADPDKAESSIRTLLKGYSDKNACSEAVSMISYVLDHEGLAGLRRLIAAVPHTW